MKEMTTDEGFKTLAAGGVNGDFMIPLTQWLQHLVWNQNLPGRICSCNAAMDLLDGLLIKAAKDLVSIKLLGEAKLVFGSKCCEGRIVLLIVLNGAEVKWMSSFWVKPGVKKKTVEKEGFHREGLNVRGD